MNLHLKEYIDSEIIPRYDRFDDAHKRDHALSVIDRSMKLYDRFGADANMVYAVAAYHDTGLCEDRKTHHLVSGRIVREDKNLLRWFTPEQIETMAQAVEDHRASAENPPRSVYGRIVAEADRNIDLDVILLRTVQYGMSHYPELDKEGHIQRALDHLKEKYGRGGYLKLWIEGSENEVKLHHIWKLMEEEPENVRKMVEKLVDRELKHRKK